MILCFISSSFRRLPQQLQLNHQVRNFNCRASQLNNQARNLNCWASQLNCQARNLNCWALQLNCQARNLNCWASQLNNQARNFDCWASQLNYKTVQENISIHFWYCNRVRRTIHFSFGFASERKSYYRSKATSATCRKLYVPEC